MIYTGKGRNDKGKMVKGRHIYIPVKNDMPGHIEWTIRDVWLATTNLTYVKAIANLWEKATQSDPKLGRVVTLEQLKKGDF